MLTFKLHYYKFFSILKVNKNLHYGRHLFKNIHSNRFCGSKP
jgi:hypothetical protein